LARLCEEQLGIDTESLRDVADDYEFAVKLLAEENLLVMPGRIFRFNNYVRLIISPPMAILEEFCNRIAAFCQRHHKSAGAVPAATG
jgi:tyrosine aminotransferase